MSIDSPTAAPLREVVAAHARRVTDAGWFSATAVAAILLNAALLGAETYAGIARDWSVQLGRAEELLLGLFTAELALRAVAHADRPSAFFRNPWNLFDAAVVLCALLPFASDNTTVLRLVRLARVIRTARFLPQLRIIVTALGKSIPGAVSFLMVGTLLLYLYAMIGWAAFADDDPEHYGSLGRAALTLFVLMTLDGLGDALYGGLLISPWAAVYYASYVLLSAFLMVNLLIGVVIDSLARAREAEEARHSPAAVATRGEELREALAAVRAGLDDMERLLPQVPAQPDRTRLPQGP
ncbi:ion transporter [Streptomyces sanyensis]|uniref:ion transporter n=1 Tax=Streptomyces sanyensis TaxID=568869 RepID=UPI003D76D51B